MTPNWSIDTDPQQQEAASPQALVARSFLRWASERKTFMLLPARLIGTVLLIAFTLVQSHTANAQVAGSSVAPTSNPSTTAASQASAVAATVSASPASQVTAAASAGAPMAVDGRRDLEQPIINLARALTKLVESKTEPEKLTTIFDLLGKLGALVGTLIAGYASYKASRNIPWFKENKEFVATVVIAVSVVVLFYLLSGIVTSVLYVLVAVLVLLIALVLAGAHLLSFIEGKYPDVRDSILSSFAESSTSKSTRKLARENTRNIGDLLSNIVFMQSLSGEEELILEGSLAEGFDVSTFRLHPAERLAAHWQIIDDRMLVPIATTLHLRDTASDEEAEVVNIQMGMVVVRIGDTLRFRRFQSDGFKSLGASIVQHQAAKMKTILEQQQSIAGNTTIFNSQSF